MAKTTKIRAIGIVAKQWRDKYGNTYYSADILVNGELHKRIGPAYGYGDQYLYSVFHELTADGVITLDCHPWRYCEEHGIQLYTSMTEVGKRSDLKN